VALGGKAVQRTGLGQHGKGAPAAGGKQIGAAQDERRGAHQQAGARVALDLDQVLVDGRQGFAQAAGHATAAHEIGVGGDVRQLLVERGGRVLFAGGRDQDEERVALADARRPARGALDQRARRCQPHGAPADDQ